ILPRCRVLASEDASIPSVLEDEVWQKETLMYYNSKGEKVSRARFKEMYNAFKNRQELIAAGLMNRRDLFRMGLLSGAGFLVAKSGLSAWADWRSSSYSG